MPLIEKYDTFWRRFIAGIVDGFVLLPVALLINFVLSGNIFNSHATGLNLLSTAFLTHVAAYLYSVLCHWKFGQTVGKNVTDIRVVDKDEKRLLTLNQAIMRDSVSIAISIVGIIALGIQIIIPGDFPVFFWFVRSMLDSVDFVWFLVEIVTMMTNDKRRAFHDMLANSVVIREEYWKGAKQVPTN